MKSFTVKQWMFISIVNFMIVGVFGLLMRMKIIFPITWFNQEFLLHAHSHFAFSGWISQVLMLLMIKEIHQRGPQSSIPSSYRTILYVNLMLSFGMLIAFTVSGYSVVSIICSFLVVLVSYGFVYLMWKDVSKAAVPIAIKNVWKGALFFNIFSSLGTYALVVLKVTHSIDSFKQLAAISFYLHFQYNGWFLLASLGLLLMWFYREQQKVLLTNLLSLLLVLTVIPCYFLSVLWWKEMPTMVFYLLIISVLIQLFIWLIIFRQVQANTLNKVEIPRVVKWISAFICIALLVKLMLQVVSLIPSLRYYTYAVRPVLIAYLHLVLLAIVSMFLLGFAMATNLLKSNKLINAGIGLLLCGILVNEILLAIQGSMGLFQFYIKYTNEGLFGAAIIMVSSLAIIVLGQARKEMVLKKL